MRIPSCSKMIAERDIQALAEMCNVLGEPNRLRIALCCLDGPASVGEIVTRVGLSQSLVSHHLRLLRATRLLKSDRGGRQIFYSLPDCHVRDMLTNLIDHVMELHEHDAHNEKETSDGSENG